MLSFFQTAKACYFDDTTKKVCYPTKCDDIYPKSKGWTVYGCSWCPYNKKARSLLESKEIMYYYYDVELEPFNSRENYKKMMSNYIGNHMTTPAIFKDGKLIGGFSNLEAMYKF
jgi:glutaredoxin